MFGKIIAVPDNENVYLQMYETLLQLDSFMYIKYT